MKTFLKALIPDNYHKKIVDFRNNYFDGYSVKSYSQEGEDMILRRIFEKQKTGFYVDIGAHHPKRFSNTYYFYRQGWCGINIDAMPGSMTLFDKFRTRDINLEIPISDGEQKLKYYVFDERALNSFSGSLSKARIENGNVSLYYTLKLTTKRLSFVLDDYIKNNREIDFLSVDVEGLDFSVLKSNNWNKYKPKVILVEISANSIEGIIDHKISTFLRREGYIIYAKTANTVVFMDYRYYQKRFR